MVTASVLGAAAGTGMALVIAVTIVIYRYHALRRKGKEWDSWDSSSWWSAPVPVNKYSKPAAPSTHVYIPPNQEFNVYKERCPVQPKVAPPPPPPAVSTATISVSSLESPQRRRAASISTQQLPRLLSVDEDHSSPVDRRSSSMSRCISPIIRAISPEGSSTAALTDGEGGSPLPRHDLIRGRSLSVDIPPGSPTLPPGSAGSGSSTGSSGFVFPTRSPSLRGAIQPDLYKKETILMDSHEGSSSHLGRLHFRLKYDFHRSDLVVFIIEAHDLATSDQGGFNDPYVRVYLLPEVDSKIRQTKIQRRSPNPYFNEVFKFPIALDDLAERTLLLQVMDYDKFSRNDVVGEVRLALTDVDVASDVEVWSDIRKNKKPPGEKQELLFSLSYLPSAERLTVVVLKARNLDCKGIAKDNLNPYVKMYLIQEGRRVKKKKTSVRRGSDYPVWNEAIAFNVSTGALPSSAIELRVQNGDTVLGSVVVGPREAGLELDHWLDMAHNMRKSVAMWHALC